MEDTSLQDISEPCPVDREKITQIDERLKKVERIIRVLIRHCPEIDFVDLMRNERRAL